MHRTSLIFCLAAAAVAQTPSGVSQGPAINVPGNEINSGSGELPSGVRIRYKSMSTPAGAPLNLIATGTRMASDGFHRFVIDKTSKSYFGYDLVIGPANASHQYQAVFQPLTGAADMVANISGNPSLKPMMLPKYPPPQFVSNGDVIALDLMVSPDGKRKLTDYIEIQAPPGGAVAAAQPLDFTLDDGPVTFEGAQNSLWINGQARELNAYTEKPGATFWIAIPGEGRYILSLAPHDGFLKNGTLRGDTISFQDGGRRYAVRFGRSIVGNGKAWNVYVMHDATYAARADLREMISAGTDRLENLWPAR